MDATLQYVTGYATCVHQKEIAVFRSPIEQFHYMKRSNHATSSPPTYVYAAFRGLTTEMMQEEKHLIIARQPLKGRAYIFEFNRPHADAINNVATQQHVLGDTDCIKGETIASSIVVELGEPSRYCCLIRVAHRIILPNILYNIHVSKISIYYF